MVLERMTPSLEELGLDAVIARSGITEYGEAQVMTEDPAEQTTFIADETGYDLALQLGETVTAKEALEHLNSLISEEFLSDALNAFNRGREDQGWQPLDFSA